MHNNIMEYFKAVRFLFEGVAFYVLIYDIAYIKYFVSFKKYKQPGETFGEFCGETFNKKKKKKIILCQVILLIGIFFSPFVFPHFQNTDIGSLLEKDVYNEQYYVYLRKDRTKAKSYRLKADIYKSYVSLSENIYFLETIYWGNGGYIDFDPSESSRIYPNREATVYDCEDERYYVVLTTEKVNK